MTSTGRARQPWIKSGHDERVWSNEGAIASYGLPLHFNSRIVCRHAFALAAPCARAVERSLAPMEGVGNAGRPLHPRPRVQL